MSFNGYALLIGTGKTKSTQFAAIPVENDIETLHALLVDPAVCGYQPEQIMVLTNEQATSKNIDRGLAWLKEQSQQHPEATIIFYYSGHGWSDSDEHYYLIQYDVADSHLSGTAYDAQNLMLHLNAIGARQMLMVFDCCRAGGVAAGKDIEDAPPVLAKGTNSPLPHVLQQALSEGGGRVVFSSSLEGQKSWFHPQVAISLFTYYFMEALQGANAKSGDTAVRIDQLIGHVSREVTAAAQSMAKTQTPTFQFAGENFPVALLQGGKGLGIGGWQAAKPQATATIERVVRQVTQTVAERGVAIGGNAHGAIITTGDSNRIIRDSPGYVENARDVQQDFSQRTVNTHGGDYAEGNITKTTHSGGVNAAGATFGNNATLAGGNVTQSTITYGASGSPTPPSPAGIQHALDLLSPVLARLAASGDEEAHDRVHQVMLYLRAARREEQKADMSRRADAIRQAQRAFVEVAGAIPDLAGLRPTFDHLV